MIIYTVTGKAGNEGYLDIAKSGAIAGQNLYVNMTNKCPCSCIFCLRNTREQCEDNTLWLKDGEPSVSEVLAEFEKYDLSSTLEIVFCGFGEPLYRIYDICKIIDTLKATYPKLKFRVNTNGLANLIHKEDITKELENRFDTVSISLNAPTAEEYLELTRSVFGIQSFEELKKFAVAAKRYVPKVVLTVVDEVMSPEKIEQCRKICNELGVTLRVRPFEK